MSLENEVKKLAEAINANTAAIKDFMLQAPAANISTPAAAPAPVTPDSYGAKKAFIIFPEPCRSLFPMNCSCQTDSSQLSPSRVQRSPNSSN